MSAHELPYCASCGANANYLNPKMGVGEGVFACECEKCGHRDMYTYEDWGDDAFPDEETGDYVPWDNLPGQSNIQYPGWS